MVAGDYDPQEERAHDRAIGRRRGRQRLAQPPPATDVVIWQVAEREAGGGQLASVRDDRG